MVETHRLPHTTRTDREVIWVGLQAPPFTPLPALSVQKNLHYEKMAVTSELFT